MTWRHFGLAGMLALSTSAAEPGWATPASTVDSDINFALLDYRGRLHDLRRADARVVVLFFSANGCPVARQSYAKLHALQHKFRERSVAFWVVDSDVSDDRDSVEQEAKTFGIAPLPVLIDDAQGLARLLGVDRTGDAVAISTRDGRVFYHGAVDDQLAEGAQRPAASAQPLERALDQFLAGTPVEVPRTVAHGCLIHFESGQGDVTRPVSYTSDIAPLLERKCASCHSPGNIGPWSMTSYEKVKGRVEMIREVVLTRRMPPWDADPRYGRFSNDRSLTRAEKERLLRWVEQGAPRGEGSDPLLSLKVPAPEWPLGTPDLVLTLPAVQEIPATGVLDYRHVKLRSPYTNDVWLGAVAIRPGNRKVVHHVILRAKFEGSDDDGSGRGEMLGGWAPGATARRAPAGTGMFLGRDAVFDVELHYTTMGAPQTDRTQIGLYLLPGRPERRLLGGAAWNTEFSIPPGEPDTEVFTIKSFRRPTWLYTLTPHMHLRGRWMKYEALYPDGSRETLLSVPRYDFNWQTTYEFAEPKSIPAGTWLLCTGGFDNSTRNPANPAPGKHVTWGEQSWDEMFIGFYTATEGPAEPRTLGDARRRIGHVQSN
ncbi:MAG: redoxin domain-containing protein [Verrucomicrobia bacterium]|nr:redoxin domain-containing protein [Verrucomicrobiota bacterium]